MTLSLWSKERLLIPRWRSFDRTIALGELDTLSKKTVNLSTDLEVYSKIRNWEDNPGIVSAGRVVQTAIVEAYSSKEVIDAAKYLVKKSPNVQPLLVKLARGVIDRGNGQQKKIKLVDLNPTEERRKLLKSQRLYRKSPISLVDLARTDLILGRFGFAKRNMEKALHYAPNDRFVIRCASRFYLNQGDPEKAYHIVQNCEATPYDPWLLAVEISLAKVVQEKPNFLEQGYKVVDNRNIKPLHISELASVLGTVELFNGSYNSAKKYFKKSLKDPTGSSMAQAAWVTGRDDSITLTIPSIPKDLESREAEVFYYSKKGEWKNAIHSCKRWVESEIYSLRPIEIGSEITSFIDDHKGTVSLIDKVWPKERLTSELLNRKAYSLALLGELDDAEETLQFIDKTNKIQWIVSIANQGLIEFRRKNLEKGEKYYERAISLFEREKEKNNANVAKIYYAREAALSKRPKASEFVEQVRNFHGDADYFFHQAVIEEAVSALNEC